MRRRRECCSVFSVAGSVIPVALPIACLSGFICFALLFWNVVKMDQDGGGLMKSANIFQYFLMIASLIVAFHTTSAYNRFWEARTALETMASNWAQAASSIMAWEPSQTAKQDGGCETTDGVIQTNSWITFKAQFIHLVSVMHANAVYFLVGNQKPFRLELLGGLGSAESQSMSSLLDPAFGVFHSLSHLLSTFRDADGSQLNAQVWTRCLGLLSQGLLSYHQACKIQDTHMPIPYLQVMYLLDVVVVLVAPVAIACWVKRIFFGVILSSVLTFAFHAIFATGRGMERPFGADVNQLPGGIHSDFTERLRCLLDESTAAALEKMAMGCASEDATLLVIHARHKKFNRVKQCSGEATGDNKGG